MRLPIAALLTVTMLAGSASAECAWVLWWEHNTSSSSYRTADANIPDLPLNERSSTSWNILGSYPSSQACDNQQASKMVDILAMWQKNKAEAKFGEHTIDHTPGGNIASKRSHFVGEQTSDYFESIRYLCLPDTVDPRGPKGH
jgi:hypothetical protein